MFLDEGRKSAFSGFTSGVLPAEKLHAWVYWRICFQTARHKTMRRMVLSL
jgi:hypothetical protein